MLITGYVLSIAGQEDGARVAFCVADATGKVSDLTRTRLKWHPPCLSPVTSALHVCNFDDAIEPAKFSFPAIFKMLETISKKLDDLKLTLTSKLDRWNNASAT